MFYGGVIGLGRYDGDFLYKMLFSIRMRKGTPTLNVSLYTTPFQFFSRVEIQNMMVIFKNNVIFYQNERGYPTLSVSLYTSPFQFFSGVELELCLLSKNVKILIKW